MTSWVQDTQLKSICSSIAITDLKASAEVRIECHSTSRSPITLTLCYSALFWAGRRTQLASRSVLPGARLHAHVWLSCPNKPILRMTLPENFPKR